MGSGLKKPRFRSRQQSCVFDGTSQRAGTLNGPLVVSLTMTSFIEAVRDVEVGDERRLMELLVDRLSTVERAQNRVSAYVEERTESLDEAEGELNAVLDLVRDDLEAAGEDAASLSTEELIDAANEGRVSEETSERIEDRFPDLARKAASGQAAFESVQPVLAEIEAESELYREVADRIRDGDGDAVEIAERIDTFCNDESSFGGEDGTVVDAIVGNVAFENENGEQPGGPGDESS